MNRLTLIAALVLGFAVTAGVAIPAPAQSQQESLGEYARKLRAERKQEGQKPVKVYTNDNIPRATGIRGSEASEKSTPSSATESKSEASQAKKPSGEHDEAYYRDRMSELRHQKEIHERELAVLQQKLGQNQMQYYPDPNKTLQQTSTPSFDSDINKLRDDIDKKKQEIAQDDQAITDLEAQCRREGCPAGWLR